jgi:formate C-acetyltransferase
MENSLKKRIDAWLNQNPELAFYERIELLRKSEKLFEGLPYSIRYGRSFDYLLSNISIENGDDGIFAGAVKRTIVSDEQRSAAVSLFRGWWEGMTLEKFQSNAYYCYSFKKNKRDWLFARPPWMLAQGHLSYDWEYLIHNGLIGFLNRIEDQMKIEPAGDTLNYLEGLKICIVALQKYIVRCAKADRSVSRDERAGRLESLAYDKPGTFLEALQLMALISVITKHVIGYDAGCLGRIDQYLLPFYERDIAEGILTRESALSMIEEFMFKEMEGAALFDHMSADTEEAQSRIDASGDDVSYLVIAGRTLDGQSCVNELSHLFIEAVHDLNMLKAPVIALRYFDGIEEDFFGKVVSAMMDNASIYVYNDETQISALTSYGIAPEDAANYGMFSCNNPTIPAMMGSLRQIWFNLAIPLELAMNRGVPFSKTRDGHEKKKCEFSLGDRLMGMMESGYYGIDTGSTDDMETMEDFLEAYRRQIRYLVGELRKGLEMDGKVEKEANAGRMRVEDCFLKGTIENACDSVTGGVKYHSFMVNGGGLATVVDSLYAIEKLVFIEKALTLSELAEILKNNFAGNELLHKRLETKFEKFGNDIPEVDKYAKIVVDNMADAIDEQNSEKYLYWMMGEISTLRDFTTEGWYVGATANGRKAGEPLSENQSPSMGADISGLTAMLNSISKIPFNRVTGGPLNVRVHPSAVSGKDGINNMSAILRTFFECGGFQIQTSIVDADTLREARRTPEKYKNLTVRVTGYNAYFTHMGEEAQDEMIRRTENELF